MNSKSNSLIGKRCQEFGDLSCYFTMMITAIIVSQWTYVVRWLPAMKNNAPFLSPSFTANLVD